MARSAATMCRWCRRPTLPRRPPQHPIRKPTCAATMSSRCRSATSPLSAPSSQHPDGFYASLARLQLEKLAAEDAHAMATVKAKEAE